MMRQYASINQSIVDKADHLLDQLDNCFQQDLTYQFNISDNMVRSIVNNASAIRLYNTIMSTNPSKNNKKGYKHIKYIEDSVLKAGNCMNSIMKNQKSFYKMLKIIKQFSNDFFNEYYKASYNIIYYADYFNFGGVYEG